MKERILFNTVEEGLEKYKYYDMYKYDIKWLLSKIEEVEMRFLKQEQDILKTDKEQDIITPSMVFTNMRPSIVAPAYNLNQYLTKLNEITVYFNLGGFNDAQLTQTELNIYMNQIFISIKTLLDRCVSLFTFYFKGISTTSTFGHVKDNGKSSGLMSKVLEMKGESPIHEYVYENYKSWIKQTIRPRDLVIHYNDLSTDYQYPADNRIIPIHLNNRVFNNETTNDSKEDYRDYTYKSFYQIIHELYEFYLTLVYSLSDLSYKITLSHYHYLKK